jgi:hypothetical protein
VLNTRSFSCQALPASALQRSTISRCSARACMQGSGNGSTASEEIVLVGRRTSRPSTRCSCDRICALPVSKSRSSHRSPRSSPRRSPRTNMRTYPACIGSSLSNENSRNRRASFTVHELRTLDRGNGTLTRAATFRVLVHLSQPGSGRLEERARPDEPSNPSGFGCSSDRLHSIVAHPAWRPSAGRSTGTAPAVC